MLNPQLALRFIFLTALLSTAGSLYFSDVLGFPPCTLCWYQRICMYPLVLVTGAGLWSEDKTVWRYVLPLALVGLMISIYHNLVYYDIISEGIIPCQKGVSCSTRFIQWLGFIDIPQLSLIAFLMVSTLGFSAVQRARE